MLNDAALTAPVIEETVEVRTVDGSAEGMLFKPDATGRWPAVIHLADIFGFRPAFRAMARRLAAKGYAVLSPNLFYRTGRPPFAFGPTFSDEQSRRVRAELTGPLTPEAIERDAAAYVDFLAASPSVADDPMGVVGHCFTGGVALRVAAARPDRIGALASFHGGRLCTSEPTSPHLLLPRLKARLYFAHADQDRSMPEEAIERLDDALHAWGGRYESELYRGASHGWTVPDSAAYNEPQAERALRKLLELLGSSQE